MGAEQSSAVEKEVQSTGEVSPVVVEKPGIFAGLKGAILKLTGQAPVSEPEPQTGGRRICRRNRKNKRLTRRSSLRPKAQKRKSLRNK